jgi:hypothetical protein
LEFESWHWKRHWHAESDDPELRNAYEATSAPTTPEEFERGFLTLLRSSGTIAQGIALDYYDRAEMTERFVGGNPFEAHEEEVFRVARQLLRQPPSPKDEHTFEGANHASALGALMRGGLDAEDTDAIAGILERMPDGSLRDNALEAAGLLLEDEAAPDPRLVAQIARAEKCGERVKEITALRDVPGDEPTESLVRATGDDEWRVQQEAAAALASGKRFYAHRALLERLVETWSEDERSTAADEVREALSDGPHSLHWEGSEPESAELREAHRELRSPTSEAAHRTAFRTMLHSGSPVAVGIALDHFLHAEGLTRFGLDDREHVPEVLAVARELLGQPPSAAALSPQTGAGASRASALNIIKELAGPDDAEAIAVALRTEGAPAVVRECAVQAAWVCLERWETPDKRVVAALEELIFDGSVDMELRTDAVNALFDLPGPQVTAVLVRAARSAELPIQVEGAIGLTFEHLIDKHRDLLQNLLPSWPQDAGDRALIVWSELGE